MQRRRACTFFHSEYPKEVDSCQKSNVISPQRIAFFNASENLRWFGELFAQTQSLSSLVLKNVSLKSSSWKKTKSLAAKKSRISEDFLDLSTENRKFRRYCTVSLFGQWNESKEFSKQLSFSGSKVHPLKRSIKDRQRICFLFVDWANWKFFFLWKKCFVSQLFFLAFKRTLLIVLLQVRRMKVKATMRQISFGQKNKGKGKKLQYGWVSECWLWYDIGWALKVIANET